VLFLQTLQFTIVVDERFNEPDNIVFHAFEYGGEVNLQGDMTVGHTLYVKKDAVLNLNGYTLRNHSGNKATDLIVVEEGATLTINGGGYLVAESGNDGYTVIAEGTVIINGGTFEAGVDAAGEANALVYARGNGKVYVNGGVFNNAHNSAFVLNKKDADRATTVIEVRGVSSSTSTLRTTLLRVLILTLWHLATTLLRTVTGMRLSTLLM
jgi:hypothetical protein